jgi:hypothetical protein
MNNSLFLICPTDALEPVIRSKFKNERYFYTSLGNSFVCDNATIAYILETVKTHNIKNIYFILSSKNKIIVDALEHQNFSDISGMHHFYKEITIQKTYAEELCYTNNLQLSVISYYLNKKIKELQLKLVNLSSNFVKIQAKVYDKDKDVFRDIYSDLVCLEKYHLN